MADIKFGFTIFGKGFGEVIKDVGGVLEKVTALKNGADALSKGFGGLGKDATRVTEKVNALSKGMDGLKNTQNGAASGAVGMWGQMLSGATRYRDVLGGVGQKMDVIHKKHVEMRATLRADMNNRLGDVATAWGVSKMVGAPVSAHMEQNAAINELEVGMMDATGNVSGAFSAIKKQAVELGNVLPGTTTDFVKSAIALNEQGVSHQAIMGGALKSASYLAVVLKMPTDAAAEMTAKLREAYKLSDGELTKMADLMQRSKFAFGMKPSDLMAATSYQAPMLRQLNITGIDNTSKMLAIQGMAANVGLEGSSFGTNFSMMLTRLAKGPAMLEEANRGMKAEAKGIMDSLGITFDFFDKKGNFAGLDHMVKELEKLKKIKEMRGDKAAMEVSEAMFGAEAARPALILAEGGMAGFEEAQNKMKAQAGLQQRIDKTLESSKNVWDSLTGSVSNFGAALAGPAVQALHPVAGVLNSATGALTKFADEHPTATKWLGLLVGGAAALTIGGLGLGVALAAGKFALSGLAIASLGGVKALGFLGNGFLLLGRSIGIAGSFMMANPILAGVAALAIGGLLLYKNWDTVSKFFTGQYAKFKKFGSDMIDGLVGGIMSKFNAAKDAITSLGSGLKTWFTSTLGIKSPSRVFMGFGGNIGEGAQIGIERSVPGVKGAMDRLSGVARAGAAAGILGAAALVGTDGGMPGAQNLLRAASKHEAMGARSGTAPVIHLTYAPVININGAGGAANASVGQQVQQAIQLSLPELQRLIAKAVAEQQRRSFN